ncbi:dynein heavy chain 3 [Huso huso]|uniref:Dynein heavy chain 3 n=1 Tax=Huso huso TaxID=61971 RepID=A0ABR0ZBZ2_HUSHU
MIYMEPMDLGWEPLVQSWLETKLPHFLTSEQKHLVKGPSACVAAAPPPCPDFIQKRCRPVVQSSQMHLTSALLKLYQCLLAEISVDSAVEREEACVETLEEQEESFQASKQKQQEETSSMIVAGAFFSVVWSLGGLLDASSKQR